MPDHPGGLRHLSPVRGQRQQDGRLPSLTPFARISSESLCQTGRGWYGEGHYSTSLWSTARGYGNVIILSIIAVRDLAFLHVCDSTALRNDRSLPGLCIPTSRRELPRESPRKRVKLSRVPRCEQPCERWSRLLKRALYSIGV